jgi:putative acetyltransferase
VSKIIKATTQEHYHAAIALFKEYATWLNIDLAFQNFDTELIQLPKMYGEPLGIILLNTNKDLYTGCIAVRNKGEKIAELKRMYVQPAYRKNGVAKELLQQAILFAKNAGYKKIRLDTLATMTPAINLYKQFGFYEIPAYYFNPESNAVFFELDL